MTTRGGWISVVAVNLLLVVVVLAIVEFGLYVLMSLNGPTGIGALDKLAQQIYWSRVHLIQYDANCAQYDRGLSYTLRPGTCTFANEGFSTVVEVNSAGLRDDEASLAAPAIIVTGDSHAMGWGVAAEQTFAQLMAVETGSKTLNAGISSYGTAREVVMLDRLDLSALRVLVVQYSDNDWWENRTYLENAMELPIQDEASYDRNVAENPDFEYFPGANLRDLGSLFVSRFMPSGAESSGGAAETTKGMTTADMFLRVLASAEVPADAVHLVVLEINTHGRGDGGFVDDAASSAELDALRGKFSSVSFIKTQDFLTDEDRLFPDGHMKGSGHQKVAKAILETINGISKELVSGSASQ